MIYFNELANDAKVFGLYSKWLNHFKQNCKRRRKKFKPSKVFSDLVNFFVNLVIFAEKPVTALLFNADIVAVNAARQWLAADSGRKSQTIFLTPIASKKAQICEVWRQ